MYSQYHAAPNIELILYQSIHFYVRHGKLTPSPVKLPRSHSPPLHLAYNRTSSPRYTSTTHTCTGKARISSRFQIRVKKARAGTRREASVLPAVLRHTLRAFFDREQRRHSGASRYFPYTAAARASNSNYAFRRRRRASPAPRRRREKGNRAKRNGGIHTGGSFSHTQTDRGLSQHCARLSPAVRVYFYVHD